MTVNAHQADPFARPPRAQEQAIAAVVRVALLWSLAYLLWRGLFTLSSTPASLVAFAAEVLAVVVFAARAWSAVRTPIVVVASADAPRPDVAAVVDATGTSEDELRTTLLSLRRVAGLERVIVVDRDGRRELSTIARRLNAHAVEESVTFDEAVLGTGTSWVLVLRSGDLPMPDLVSICAPRCSSHEVAVVQVGIEEADPTSFEHDPDGRWSLESFAQQVVRPSLAARGSIPWYGDGPALVRRSALDAIDRSGSANMLDDSRRRGLALIAGGMVVTCLPLTLARVRGPHGMGESLLRRHRRTRSALRSLRPRDLAPIGGSARTAHLLALTALVSAGQRVLLVITAVLVLGFAQTPISTAAVWLVLFAVPGYALRWSAHLLLGRGRLRPLSILRGDLRSLGVDLMPFGREPGGRTGLFAVAGTAVALHGVVIVASISMWRSWDDRLPLGLAVMSLVITAGFLGVVMEVLLDVIARRQRRRNRRVRLGLVTCRIEEHEGQLVNLSTGGAGIVVAIEPEQTFSVGDVTTMSFRIPDAEGAWKSVSTLVHVAHSSSEPGGGTHLGLTFDDPTAAPLDPVIEFLTIDRRLVALGRHETMSA